MSKSDPARAALRARYLSALRAHLLEKAQAGDGDRAQGLGRAALAAGMVGRDIALMHERAVLALAASHNFLDTRNGAITRAGAFFAQALIPLEAAERATREANQRLQQRNETLRLHTAELARGNHRLEREVARREAVEAALRKGREEYETLFKESQVMQRKLREVTRQIIAAQEEERKKISRELHDEVVQTLVGINVELSALNKGAATGIRALRTKIAHTQRLVENSVVAVHRFARGLRPSVLDDLGLIPALHAFIKTLAARKKFIVQMTAYSGVEQLSAVKRTVLYRVAQEALTNVARHSGASQVKVAIVEVDGLIRMEIHDNGKSFQVGKTLAARTKRLGLIGMKERTEMVGGSLVIESAPGAGTTVRVDLPFKPEKASA